MAHPLAEDLRRAAVHDAERTAVTDGRHCLTYAGLDAAVAGLASRLTERGVRAGSIVAWHGRKTAAAVVAVHASLRAGAGYAPLDPDGPTARTRLITGRLRAAALLTDSESRARWDADGAPWSWQPIDLPHLGETLFLAADLPQPRTVDGVAYVLHTSGSTGVPKAVVHTHASADAFVDWAVDALHLGPDDVVLNTAPLHFDLSTLDLFGACRAGAALAIMPEADAPYPAAYAAFAHRVGATVWYTVPSALAWLTRRGPALLQEMRSVRIAAFAGEVLRAQHVATLHRALPAAQVWNLYGPTETNVCTFHEVERHPAPVDPVPIGRPLPGTHVMVVDDARQPVQPGTPGELLVAGNTLMSGYLDQEDRPPVFADLLGQAWYPTGDQVVAEEHGALRFIGRKDQQVKSRGYRIELGEIERLVSAIPDVEDCIAVAVPDQIFGTTVTAFVETVGEPEPAFLGDRIRSALPGYMVPHRLLATARPLPRTNNGKTDRALLADVAREATPMEGAVGLW